MELSENMRTWLGHLFSMMELKIIRGVRNENMCQCRYLKEINKIRTSEIKRRRTEWDYEILIYLVLVVGNGKCTREQVKRNLLKTYKNSI